MCVECLSLITQWFVTAWSFHIICTRLCVLDVRVDFHFGSFISLGASRPLFSLHCLCHTHKHMCESLPCLLLLPGPFLQPAHSFLPALLSEKVGGIPALGYEARWILMISNVLTSPDPVQHSYS